MANAAALINEGLWRKDKEFQRLPRLAQCTFCQVLTQKDLDTAGGLTLHLELLAKACDELTVEQLKADFAVLEDHRFLFVDYDTDELLVRSYVRLVSANSPKNNAWRSVPKNARLIGSEKLRHELAMELRRLRRKEANDLADEIDPLPTPSKPPPNPLETRSGPAMKSEGGSDPPSSVPVSVLVSPSVVGSVGQEPPSEFCPKHPNDTDKACFACGQFRRTYAVRKAKWDADVRAAAATARQAAIDGCLLCDEFGEITFEDSVRKCSHEEAAHA